ncbi:MAG: hypothetical protein K0S55_293 [Clostridia bacterium]|nr:hypothetical protein [Clostridia bacterium]
MKKDDYNRIIDGFKSDENMKTRIKIKVMNNNKKANIFNLNKKVFTTAFILVFIFISIFTIPFLYNINTQNNNYYGFIVITKAEDGTEKPLTDVALPLDKYSLFMSSVPGLPFTVKLKENNTDKIVAIRIEVAKGRINTWNQTDYKVIDRGSSFISEVGQTFYWSPLSDTENKIKESIITITAVKGGKDLYSQKISIKSDNEGIFYSAVLLK